MSFWSDEELPTHLIMEPLWHLAEVIRMQRIIEYDWHIRSIPDHDVRRDENVWYRACFHPLRPVPVGYAELVCGCQVTLELIRWCF